MKNFYLYKEEWAGDGIIGLSSKTYYRLGGKDKFSCKGVNKKTNKINKEKSLNVLLTKQSLKEKESDELKDQCLALRLDNDGLRYIMLCQDCCGYLDSKRPGDTVEGYSCPSCIGVMGPSRNLFSKDT